MSNRSNAAEESCSIKLPKSFLGQWPHNEIVNHTSNSKVDMKKHILLIFVLLGGLNLYAQIDTSVYYPLNDGDYWEYAGYFLNEVHREYIKVLGDTIMPNNKEYKVLECVLDWVGQPRSTTYKFQRVEDKYKVYQYKNRLKCPDDETLLYDFSKKDSMFSETCNNEFPLPNAVYYSVTVETGQIYEPVFNQVLEVRYMTDVKVTSDPQTGTSDTVWFVTPGRGHEWVVKGVGLVESLNEFSPLWEITGAIINGTAYGTFTKVEEDRNLQPSDHKLYAQVYPNPFNSSTNIKVKNINDGEVEIKIYDVLGREIKTLYKGRVKGTTLNLQFNAGSLPSGTYILVAANNSSIFSTQFMLLK